jgi:CHAT domain-containing protein
MMAQPPAMADSEYEQNVVLLFERGMALESQVSGAAMLLTWGDADSTSRVTVSDLAARLPHDTALVEFVRIQDPDPVPSGQTRAPEEEARYLAFTLTGSGRLSLVDLGAARTIDELVSDLQSSLRGQGQPALLVDLLRALYSRLWFPLEGLVGEAGQVIVSADGELHRVPFAALMDAKAQSLIERYRFAYAGSGRDLVSARRPSTSPGQDLVLVANPDFAAGTRFDPLPGTAREAQLIPPLVSGHKGRTILVGRAATKSAVMGVRSPRILHIATHGFFLERDTLGVEGRGYEHSLIRSGLALAPANAGDDGMLTALEISDMDLAGTQLVVLSACDTGAGSVTRGQGVLGLRRAFALAGARSVLTTLWPVDDAVTAPLMASFYRNIAKLPPAEALHRAQTELLERLRTSGGFANPRLWAPFLLEGPTGFTLLPGG